MVRLRRLPPCARLHPLSQFQSHYGAIATHASYNIPPIDTLISIPLWCDCDYHFARNCGNWLSYFNPTMVRLRRSKGDFEAAERTTISIPLWCDCDADGCIQGICNDDFNPTMVRLRPKLALTPTCASVRFQSHYGAIATSLMSHMSLCSSSFQSHYGAIATSERNHLSKGRIVFQSHYGAIATCYSIKQLFT